MTKKGKRIRKVWSTALARGAGCRLAFLLPDSCCLSKWKIQKHVSMRIWEAAITFEFSSQLQQKLLRLQCKICELVCPVSQFWEVLWWMHFDGLLFKFWPSHLFKHFFSQNTLLLSVCSVVFFAGTKVWWLLKILCIFYLFIRLQTSLQWEIISQCHTYWISHYLLSLLFCLLCLACTPNSLDAPGSVVHVSLWLLPEWIQISLVT